MFSFTSKTLQQQNPDFTQNAIGEKIVYAKRMRERKRLVNEHKLLSKREKNPSLCTFSFYPHTNTPNATNEIAKADGAERVSLSLIDSHPQITKRNRESERKKKIKKTNMNMELIFASCLHIIYKTHSPHAHSALNTFY